MLTVDHVKLRRRKGLVEIAPLCGLKRDRARELAGYAVDVAREHEGHARAALEEALDELPLDGSAAEARFGRGLKKLIVDASDFDVDSPLPPDALRAEVFRAAADARLAGSFDRARLLHTLAEKHGVSVEVLERALYADLGAAHAVTKIDIVDADDLLARYDVAELQAVLLRATRLVVDVDAPSPQIRALLRALKLHQLLFDVETREEGVHLVVEGPMGLFQQSTRYGLKLAMLLPALLACRRVRLEATVRLRKEGGPETFVLEHAREGAAPDAAGELPDVVRDLLADLEKLETPWRARPAVDVLHLPGAGALVPDVQLVHAGTGEVVFLEVLGFWSRAAVWRRVELVEKGLPLRVVFCASERLRVSEEALPAESGGALVVFKGSLRATRVLEAVERVTYRTGHRGGA